MVARSRLDLWVTAVHPILGGGCFCHTKALYLLVRKPTLDEVVTLGNAHGGEI